MCQGVPLPKKNGVLLKICVVHMWVWISLFWATLPRMGVGIKSRMLNMVFIMKFFPWPTPPPHAIFQKWSCSHTRQKGQFLIDTIHVITKNNGTNSEYRNGVEEKGSTIQFLLSWFHQAGIGWETTKFTLRIRVRMDSPMISSVTRSTRWSCRTLWCAPMVPPSQQWNCQSTTSFAPPSCQQSTRVIWR